MMPMPVRQSIYVLKTQIHAVWSSIVLIAAPEELGSYDIIILQVIWRSQTTNDRKLPFGKLFICNAQLLLYPGPYVCKCLCL